MTRSVSRAVLQKPVSMEAMAFVSIFMLDTVFTIWLVGRGIAAEANPVMRFYLDRGVWAFVAIRTLILAPVFVLEAQGRCDPRRIRTYFRAAILVYVAVYLFGTLAQLGRLIG